MAKTCEICGKSSTSGVKYKRRGLVRRKGGAGSKIVGKTLRRFLPNLQKIKIILNGTVKRTNVCTSCIQGNKIVKG